MRTGFVVLCAALLAAGSSCHTPQPSALFHAMRWAAPRLPRAAGVDATVLALGDSYTIGESVRTEQSWPHQLADSLADHGVRVTELAVEARTGWTTSDLLRAVERYRGKRRDDLVTLLIGVNNQFQGLPFDLYQAEFRDLVGVAVAFAGGEASRVIVLSIPDYGVTPFGQGRDPDRIRAEIDAYNGFGRAVASGLGVHYVDVTAISRLASTDPGLIAKDGLHPSSKMYTEWVKVVLPIAVETLYPASAYPGTP